MVFINPPPWEKNVRIAQGLIRREGRPGRNAKRQKEMQPRGSQRLQGDPSSPRASKAMCILLVPLTFCEQDALCPRAQVVNRTYVGMSIWIGCACRSQIRTCFDRSVGTCFDRSVGYCGSTGSIYLYQLLNPKVSHSSTVSFVQRKYRVPAHTSYFLSTYTTSHYLS